MDYIVELIKYIVLGIIQGITEIFPISSSGHVAIASYLMFGSAEVSQTLTLILTITNMGSFLALLIFYWKDVVLLLKDSYGFVFNKLLRNDQDVKHNFFYVLKLLIAIIPIGIIGYLFSDYLNIYTNFLTIGVALVATALFLFLVWLLRNVQFQHDITWKNAAIIGIFQTFAVLPGLSRSGITMVGGLSQKIELKKVLRFSFLSYLIISVPVSLLGVKEAIDIIKINPNFNVLGLILAFIFSFILSFVTVKIMYQFVKVKNLIWFALYALLLGSVSFVIYFI